MKPCNKPCNVCPYINTTKTTTSNQTKKTFDLKGLFTCATTGVIYLADCSKCHKQYVGQTGRKFHDRVMEHLNSIFHKTNTIGIHFSSPQHKHTDFSVQVIEKVLPNTVNLRLEREEFWIKTLGTLAPLGLNKQTQSTHTTPLHLCPRTNTMLIFYLLFIILVTKLLSQLSCHQIIMSPCCQVISHQIQLQIQLLLQLLIQFSYVFSYKFSCYCSY